MTLRLPESEFFFSRKTSRASHGHQKPFPLNYLGHFFPSGLHGLFLNYCYRLAIVDNPWELVAKGLYLAMRNSLQRYAAPDHSGVQNKGIICKLFKKKTSLHICHIRPGHNVRTVQQMQNTGSRSQVMLPVRSKTPKPLVEDFFFIFWHFILFSAKMRTLPYMGLTLQVEWVQYPDHQDYECEAVRKTTWGKFKVYALYFTTLCECQTCTSFIGLFHHQVSITTLYHLSLDTIGEKRTKVCLEVRKNHVLPNFFFLWHIHGQQHFNWYQMHPKKTCLGMSDLQPFFIITLPNHIYFWFHARATILHLIIPLEK